jgi:ketosteroid isomerase-like protein
MKDKRLDNGPDIKAIFGTWIAGYDEENLDQVMSVFDPSVIYSAPCYPDQNYAGLKKWFQFDFDRSGVRPHWSFTIEFMETSGNLAVVISDWVGHTDFGTRLQAKVHHFRSVDVLRLGASGWKIIRTVNQPDDCFPSSAKTGKKPRKKK